VAAFVEREAARLERIWETKITGYGFVPSDSRYTYLSISYDIDPFRPGNNLVIPQQTLNNNTNVTQSQQFSWEESTQRTYSYTFTETLNVGTTITVSAEFPGFGGASAEARMDLSLSKSTTQSKSETQTWKVDIPVVVPAKSRVVCSSLISTGNQEARFYVKLRISGSFWINTQKYRNHQLIPGLTPILLPVGNPVTYYLSVGVLTNELPSHIYGPHYEKAGGDIIVKPNGFVRAGFGVSIFTDFSESPLPRSLGDLVEVTRKYSVLGDGQEGVRSRSSDVGVKDTAPEAVSKELLPGQVLAGVIWEAASVDPPADKDLKA